MTSRVIVLIMITGLKRSVQIVGLSALALSCDVHDCTLAACDSGLLLLFPGGRPGPLTLSLTSPDAGARTVACDNNPCGAVTVRDYTPSSVQVEIVGPNGTVIRSFTPTYNRLQPNGPDCGPTCNQATLVFD